MRQLPWILLGLCACSGDDSHRTVSHPHPTTPVAAVVADAGAGSAAPTAATGTLTEDMAISFFTKGDALEGAQQLALQSWKPARDAFALALAAAKTDEEKAHLHVVLGMCEENLNDAKAAAPHFLFALKSLPELADFLGYHAARALWLAHQGAEALDLAKKVAPDSIVGADAQILIGDLLAAKGDNTVTAAHYAKYLADHPNGPFRSEARFDLANAMTDRDAANKLYRQITIDDPLSSWTTKAKAKLAGTTVAPFTAAEHIAHAMVLFDNQRNPESEAGFADALAEPKITPAEKCVAAYHRAQSRFKARDRKGAAPMFDEAADACKAAGNQDLEIKSDYNGGRSYSFFGEHETAVKRYQAAQAIDPKHSYADDSMLREAEEWAAMNNGKQVEAVLGALPAKYPDGDNVAEAMWRLGWRAWREKRVDDAIKWWKKQIELVPHDDNYFAEGEAQYWLGRAYLAKGKKAEALASWEAGVKQYPVAYYALQGLNRIRDTDAKRYEKVIAELTADPAGFDPQAPAFTFKPRVEWGAPGFQRAMELLRLGLGDPAALELKKLGLTAPAGKKRVDDPDQIEKLWAMAYLYDRAGRYATSHWPTRWHILDYRKTWPTGANRARWLIAYPKAYWELLTRHAAANKTPIAMQIGIVREESAFDPRTESYANAWGLTQMIPPTAKDFSKGTGIAPTRENMFDPEMNVTVGGRFLGHLFERFKGFTLLVPPGYNAGPGAVNRMLKVRGTWDADEFIEGIVDDQARNYSKRVLGTFFTYSWLYEGTVPPMPNKIPDELLPKP
jgi:soluble lytic murein transglycosylase